MDLGNKTKHSRWIHLTCSRNRKDSMILRTMFVGKDSTWRQFLCASQSWKTAFYFKHNGKSLKVFWFCFVCFLNWEGAYYICSENIPLVFTKWFNWGEKNPERSCRKPLKVCRQEMMVIMER